MSAVNLPVILFIDPREKSFINEDADDIEFGQKVKYTLNNLVDLIGYLDVTLLLGNKPYRYSCTYKTIKKDTTDIPNPVGYLSDYTQDYIDKFEDFVKRKKAENQDVIIVSNMFLSYDATEVLSGEKIMQLYHRLSQNDNVHFCFYNEEIFEPGNSEFINEIKTDKNVKYINRISWSNNSAEELCAAIENLYPISATDNV